MDIDETRQQLLDKKLKLLHRHSHKPGASPFSPIYLQAILSDTQLTFPLYLKVMENNQEGQGRIKFLPFLKEQEIPEPQWMQRLQGLGIDRLYFRNEDMEPVIAYLNNCLIMLDLQSGCPPRDKLLVCLEYLNFSLRQAFKSPHLGTHVSQAQGQVTRLIQELQKDTTPLKLVWELLYRDYNLYNHSLNVCLLGMGMMIFLKRTQAEVRLMGLVGLFHDVGMTRVSEEILARIDPLTPDEMLEMKSHPWHSYRMLKPYPALPREGLRLVLEHHEDADGSGYPQGLPLAKQHPLTRLIRLVDTYDALTAHRPYRIAQTPFAALKFLQEQMGRTGPLYDLPSLKSFIRFLALPA